MAASIQSRPTIMINEHYTSATECDHDVDPAIEKFHKTLPDYAETLLVSLPDVARELGVGHVFVKDESTRFGLPSFKIAGASWAVHQALCKELDLPNSSPLPDIAAKAKISGIRLVTCTEGNWGRAIARMAKYLSIEATIYVPGFMNTYTRNLIRSEGAELKVLINGSYDDSIVAARHDSETHGSLLIMDTSWVGYTEIPSWVTAGYSTMLRETDRQVAAQTKGRSADLAFASCGVGSWAHSVVAHYRSKDGDAARVIIVEPDSAACMKESLHRGELTSVVTGETIMNGMNCGTPSLLAWNVIREGAYAAVTVTDLEAHEDVQFLQDNGVNAGPCGAATLATARKFCVAYPTAVNQDTTLLLFSTEGMRDYEVPI